MQIFLMLFALLLVGCGKTEPANPQASAYVDSRSCEGCHAQIALSYRQTGMARAFHKIDPEEVPGGSFVHQASGRSYQFSTREGRVYLKRDEVGGGNPIEKEIHYVLGSGNHARSFLHRSEQGRLIEMPVNWYPEKGGIVAMSPGYDRPDHMDMRRAIGYECVFCHNGYPKQAGTSLFDDAVFGGEMPQGIDCQRCHGPGREHASTMGKGKILNPKKLSGERQMEVCMQCHLESTSFSLPNSIVRFEQAIFGYDPREPLEKFIAHFDHAKGSKEADKFEIASSAYRLRQSKCFLKSNDKLTCTTCHNPHEKTKSVDAACANCHGQMESSAKHPAKADCASCHMPKRRTEDVIHVVVTDHKIQKPVAKQDLLAARVERHEQMGSTSYQGEVALYYPKTLDDDLYPALAQVMHQSNLKQGIPRLEAELEKRKPTHPAYYLQMAQALHAAGEAARALPYYEKALAIDAKYLPALRSKGMSQFRAGDVAGAKQTLEKTVALHPKDSMSWLELARLYRSEGKGGDAATAARKAIEQEPELVDAHKTLGTILMETGDRTGAEQAFRSALREQPDEAEVQSNVANLLAARGEGAEAERHFLAAIRIAPELKAARFNYAVYLAGQKRFAEAMPQAIEFVKLDPRNLEAHDLLGNLYMAVRNFREAAGQYSEILKLNPGYGRAQLGLGTALGAANDFAGARKFLTQAANSTDAAVKAEAVELLRSLP